MTASNESNEREAYKLVQYAWWCTCTDDINKYSSSDACCVGKGIGMYININLKIYNKHKLIIAKILDLGGMIRPF